MTIKVGDFTIIDTEPYSCVKIEDGVAYLKKVSENKGRHLQMEESLVPHFKDGELILPEKPKVLMADIISRTVNIPKLIREHTGRPVSRQLA